MCQSFDTAAGRVTAWLYISISATAVEAWLRTLPLDDCIDLHLFKVLWGRDVQPRFEACMSGHAALCTPQQYSIKSSKGTCTVWCTGM